MQWGKGAVGADAGGGIEYGVAFPAKRVTRGIGTLMARLIAGLGV